MGTLLGAGFGTRRRNLDPHAGECGGALPGAGTPDHCRAADMDELDAALGGLRAAGWPAPEDPDGDVDAELDGRGLICDRP
jgi:hypothetical protein